MTLEKHETKRETQKKEEKRAEKHRKQSEAELADRPHERKLRKQEWNINKHWMHDEHHASPLDSFFFVLAIFLEKLSLKLGIQARLETRHSILPWTPPASFSTHSKLQTACSIVELPPFERPSEPSRKCAAPKPKK